MEKIIYFDYFNVKSSQYEYCTYVNEELDKMMMRNSFYCGSTKSHGFKLNFSGVFFFFFGIEILGLIYFLELLTLISFEKL